MDLTPSPVRAHFFCRGCLQRFGVHSATWSGERAECEGVSVDQNVGLLSFSCERVVVRKECSEYYALSHDDFGVRVHGVSRLTHSTSFPGTCYPGIVIGQRLSWGVFVLFCFFSWWHQPCAVERRLQCALVRHRSCGLRHDLLLAPGSERDEDLPHGAGHHWHCDVHRGVSLLRGIQLVG